MPCHLEIEEVAVDVDATLHQIVVEKRRREVFHEISASAVAIKRTVETHHAFQIIEVEARHVDIDLCTEFRDFILVEEMQLVQIGIFDHSLKVGLGLLFIMKINQTVEIEEQIIVVNPNLTFEPVLLEAAIHLDFCDMVP